jgi:L-iditol 2-dehydrogenase
MKSLQLVAARRLEIRDIPEPAEVGPDEIVVRVKAVGICGTDIHYYQGESAGYTAMPYPFIMGHEFAGTIERVGRQVTAVRPGDRVAVDPSNACMTCESCLEGHPNVCPEGRFTGSPGFPGAMQELIVHPARLAFPLPEGMSFTEGALLEPLGVALHAVDLGRIRIADTVAVLGCGPIGLTIVRLARVAGAQEVFATEAVGHRRRLAEKCGATLALDPTREDTVRRILDATHGRGVDVAFEVAGAVETPELAAEVAKACGRVIVVGICSEDRMPFRSTPARKKGLTIKVSRRMGHVYARTLALVRRGMVDVSGLVTHVFPLERGPEGFALLDGYRGDVGKVVIALD